MSLSTGTVLENRYRIDALLGEGGMGAVYRAWHLTLDQNVAVKENRLASAASARQFSREAKMMARLSHPNLPGVIDHFVLAGGAQYLVMQYIEGEDLGQMLQRTGPLDEPRALAWVDQVCGALEYLHNQQPPIIHRDIKPGNIKITPEGQVFLVDFGIAKVGEAREKTRTGALGVTPGFSPLEQYGAGGTDARSDIYALAATLYTLLTGRVPPDSVQRSAQEEQLIPSQALRPDLSPGAASAISAALEIRRTDRPQTIAAFRALLREQPKPIRPEHAPAVPQQPSREKAKPPASKPVPSLRPAQKTPRPREGSSRATSRRRVPVWAWMVGGTAALLLCCITFAALGETLPSLFGTGSASPSTPGPNQTRAATPITQDPSVEPPPVEPTEMPTEPAETPVVSLGDIWTRPADDMALVYVPAGEFEMGSSDGRENERPVHTVALDGFWIDRTEVTNGQYQRCVGAGQCDAPVESKSFTRDSYYGNSVFDDYPVVYVNWHQAAGYCSWAGARLPTEAEWEYAARGPDGFEYPWGNSAPDDSLLNSDRNVGDTTEVGSYPDGASWCGALDMAGNVWKWVADWYAEDYYATSPSQNPEGPSSGERRVLRAGSWFNASSLARGAYRAGLDPDDTFYYNGFRCARSSD